LLLGYFELTYGIAQYLISNWIVVFLKILYCWFTDLLHCIIYYIILYYIILYYIIFLKCYR